MKSYVSRPIVYSRATVNSPHVKCCGEVAVPNSNRKIIITYTVDLVASCFISEFFFLAELRERHGQKSMLDSSAYFIYIHWLQHLCRWYSCITFDRKYMVTNQWCRLPINMSTSVINVKWFITNKWLWFFKPIISRFKSKTFLNRIYITCCYGLLCENNLRNSKHWMHSHTYSCSSVHSSAGCVW